MQLLREELSTHDHMIRPTVRLMPTSESVKSGRKLIKTQVGEGEDFSGSGVGGC